MSSSLTQVKATPVKQITPSRAATESPGNWKHPRLAEITRRQSKNIFSEKNARQIAYNVAALAIIGVVRKAVLPALPSWVIGPILRQYGSFIYTTLILIPLLNIALALLPLVRPKDDLSDIPLTPAQRKLLGLPPSSRAASPGPDSPAAYSTPPRYSRTPSLAGSPASTAAAASYSGSPLSNFGSPLNAGSSTQRYPSPQRFGGGGGAGTGPSPSKFAQSYTSPSPSSAAVVVSPLLHKTLSNNAAAASSSFFGASTSSSTFGASTSSTSPSSFGASTASSYFGEGPATPTPAGKRSSVGLNSKWLYEKGRRSSGSWLGSSLS